MARFPIAAVAAQYSTATIGIIFTLPSPPPSSSSSSYCSTAFILMLSDSFEVGSILCAGDGLALHEEAVAKEKNNKPINIAPLSVQLAQNAAAKAAAVEARTHVLPSDLSDMALLSRIAREEQEEHKKEKKRIEEEEQEFIREKRKRQAEKETSEIDIVSSSLPIPSVPSSLPQPPPSEDAIERIIIKTKKKRKQTQTK